MNEGTEFWRKCSSCKKPIAFNSPYYECSVSTCTGLRTGYVFCSVSCWEVHLPGAKHRNAGAIEKKSPSLQQFKSIPAATMSHQSSSSTLKTDEVLVVVSKMKQYIKDLSEMNTSEDVNQVLSDKIRLECEKAIAKARADGRKTVMARDFK